MRKVIEQKWLSFFEACGESWSARQAAAMETAFYAGATGFFAALNESLEMGEDHEPTEGELDNMNAMVAELEGFALQRMHTPDEILVSEHIRRAIRRSIS